MAAKRPDGETVKKVSGETVKRPAAQTVKTSLQLDPITAARLAGLVAITGEGHSAIVALAVENYLARLGPDKRNAVQGIVIARLGTKVAEPVKVDDVSGRGEQGGPLSPEPELVPEVTIAVSRVNPSNRLAAISNIHKRSTGDPIDAAIAGSYQGDRFSTD